MQIEINNIMSYGREMISQPDTGVWNELLE